MQKNKNLAESAQRSFGKRIVAALVDLTLWFILFSIATANFGTTTTVTNNHQTTTQASLSGLPSLLFMLSWLAYFVLMEWRLGGTLGKLLLGLRVVSTTNGPLTLKQSFIRNALRIVDAFPYIIPYLVGLITSSVSTTKQRLGDKLARTMVVSK